jgi:hypothetical protein
MFGCVGVFVECKTDWDIMLEEDLLGELELSPSLGERLIRNWSKRLSLYPAVVVFSFVFERASVDGVVDLSPFMYVDERVF